MSDGPTLWQVAGGVVTTLGALGTAWMTYRTKMRTDNMKHEEHALTVLLQTVKDERAALKEEREHAEAMRAQRDKAESDRNRAEDETHNCEEELEQVRVQISLLEKHQRACEQLRREFDEFKRSVFSGTYSHVQGPAE